MQLHFGCNRIAFRFALSAFALLAATLTIGTAQAQAPAAVLQSGDAVVTGFSGAPQPAQVTIPASSPLDSSSERPVLPQVGH